MYISLCIWIILKCHLVFFLFPQTEHIQLGSPFLTNLVFCTFYHFVSLHYLQFVIVLFYNSSTWVKSSRGHFSSSQRSIRTHFFKKFIWFKQPKRSTCFLLNESHDTHTHNMCSKKISFFFFLFFFWLHCSMQKFPGQGSNPCNCCNQSHSSDNAKSLTHWVTRKFQKGFTF